MLRGLWRSFPLIVLALHVGIAAEEPKGNALLHDYFRLETEKLAKACLDDVRTLNDWTGRQEELRRQLREMLGLDPATEKTPLEVTVTGTVEHEEFTVENLHYQSRPGLYVTANLYVPKEREGPLPTILYVCGHARAVENGVRYGNKTSYQHHAAWFARHGYVCMVLDTVQRGEIPGIHHGTYGRQIDGKWEHMWWWNSRGYTPAGVETWNCIRALDYLETRPEVDADRFGVTGRSGGGVYSWWIAAIDERIKVAVPVAGITDLQNYVVAGFPGRYEHGCVDGHCDCMFMVNTYRWDYPLVAALVAPRPLLIENSDKDAIFPLDGVVRLHDKVRKVYRLYDKEENLGLHITEGPHQDTQELRVGAFHWFNRHLKGEDPLIAMPAEKVFEPKQLKVLDKIPTDEITTTIQESFVPLAESPVPKHEKEWSRLQNRWLEVLEAKVFRGFPDAEDINLNVKRIESTARGTWQLDTYEYTSQPPWRLKLFVLRKLEGETNSTLLMPVATEEVLLQWNAFQQSILAESGVSRKPNAGPWNLMAENNWDELDVSFVVPVVRGIGSTAWQADGREQAHIRRRFALLGQTLDGMRVWDIIQATRALQEIELTVSRPVTFAGKGNAAVLSLYASLSPHVSHVKRLFLVDIPDSHRNGPQFLNINRYFDIPQAVALAAARGPVELAGQDLRDWKYPLAVAKNLGWPAERLTVTTDSARTR